MKLSKIVSILQIVTQLFYSSFCMYAFSFNASADTTVPPAKQQANSSSPNTKSEPNSTENEAAGIAMQAGSLLASDSAADSLKNSLVSGVTGKATQSVEEWLNQFGTARVKVSTDNNFSLQDAELDVLLPLYDDKTNLFFTQLGARRADDRNIMNTGVGYRHFSEKWMWGANTFYDRQLSENHHQRLGVGGELGWDYLKVSANGYLRLTDWMASARYQDYDERAANGFDIRTEGYLPAWPQLGASVMYEQYFGKNVDLFNDEDNRQKDPYAVTVGLNYTPFTLLTAGISQKMGKGDTQDTQFSLGVSYAPGVSLDKQLDPDQVALKRSLMGSRMELVSRNNTIVLDYRKQDLISLGLPSKIEGAEKTTLPVSAVVNSKYGVDHIDWQANELTAHGGSIKQDKNGGQYSITLPAYQYSASANHYTVTGKAYDEKGNGSNLSEMQVYVTGADAATWSSSASVSSETILADGISTSTVTLRISSSDQQTVTGVADQLTATIKLTPLTSGSAPQAIASKNASIAAFGETSPGVYTSTFNSGTVAGTAEITPMVSGKTALQSARIVLQAPDVTPSLSKLAASKTSALANGTDTITLSATVLDPQDLPYKDAKVSWQTDNSAAGLSAAQSISDENGLATVTVSSVAATNTVVTATVEGGNSLQSEALNFTLDTATAQVTSINADKNQAIADNTDKVTLTANVINAQNQPLKDAKVDWKVEQGSAAISEPQTTTDEQGNAKITLTSAAAGDVLVSARTGTTDAKTTNKITFGADSSHMRISSLTQDKNQAVANDTDVITLSTTVTDTNGNILNDVEVKWVATPTSGSPSETTTRTNSEGVATFSLSSAAVTDYSVKASINGAEASSPTLHFTADLASAYVDTLTADKTTNVVAGKDTVTLTATVLDTSHHPVEGATVNWSSDNSGAQLTPASGVTNSLGVAQAQLTGTKAQSTVVMATTTSSTKTQSVDIIADKSTAKFDSVVVNKPSVVADGADQMVWTAVIKDANQNLVSGETVNWSLDNADALLAGSSSVTDSNGVATITATSLKTGKAIATAALMDPASSQNSAAASFIADEKTAYIKTLTADQVTVAADDRDTVTYSAQVFDANQNIVSGAAVNWIATINTLSASTSMTDDSGIATINLHGKEKGKVTVTGSISKSSVQNSDVVFLSAVTDNWNITGATGKYTSSVINGYKTLAFTAEEGTTGPTTLIWKGDYSPTPLTTVLTDEDGNVATVTFKGQRQSRCTIRSFNDAIECSSTSEIKAILNYSATDNPDLPTGVYHGVIHFAGRDWHESYAFDYKVSVTLTVQ